MLIRCFVSATLLLTCAASPAADEPSPGLATMLFQSLRDGDKVSGSCGLCLLTLDNRPVACFGLRKAVDDKGAYTYFILIKTNPDEKFDGSGTGGQINFDGKMTKLDAEIEAGERTIELGIRQKYDDDQKLLSQTLIAGGKEYTGEQLSFVLDLTGEKPVFHSVKAKPPATVPDFADKEQDSWGPTIQKAAAEFQKSSEEVRKLMEARPKKEG